MAFAFKNSTHAHYFPTGMTWEEVTVIPQAGNEPATVFNTRVYEIGPDTLVGDVTYKKVFEDGKSNGLCIREDNEKVWLLTKDYPSEILLYDFDWNSGECIVTEFLRVDTRDEIELCRDTMQAGDYQTMTYDYREWQFHHEIMRRSTIRGIGNVADLNRFPSLLGYSETWPILPGLEWAKVIWIIRDGEEIFRSEDYSEWTNNLPTSVSGVSPKDKVEMNNEAGAVYDLQGRRIGYNNRETITMNREPLKPGVYIRNGKKIVKK